MSTSTSVDGLFLPVAYRVKVVADTTAIIFNIRNPRNSKCIYRMSVFPLKIIVSTACENMWRYIKHQTKSNIKVFPHCCWRIPALILSHVMELKLNLWAIGQRGHYTNRTSMSLPYCNINTSLSPTLFQLQPLKTKRKK